MSYKSILEERVGAELADKLQAAVLDGLPPTSTEIDYWLKSAKDNASLENKRHTGFAYIFGAIAIVAFCIAFFLIAIIAKEAPNLDSVLGHGIPNILSSGFIGFTAAFCAGNFALVISLKNRAIARLVRMPDAENELRPLRDRGYYRINLERLEEIIDSDANARAYVECLDERQITIIEAWLLIKIWEHNQKQEATTERHREFANKVDRLMAEIHRE